MKVPITSRAANAQAHTLPATPVAPTPIAIPAAIPAAQENMLGRSTEEPAPNNRVSYARAWLNSCLCATQSRLAHLNPCNRDQRNLRAGYEPIIDAPIDPDSPAIDPSPAQHQHNAQWISNTGMLCRVTGPVTRTGSHRTRRADFPQRALQPKFHSKAIWYSSLYPINTFGLRIG